MLQERVGEKDVIWIIVNAEDTQGIANEANARGCRELCAARVDAQADMLYGELLEQAEQMREGARIIMHQGGARRFGGQLLLAAGRVRFPVQSLTADHVQSFPHLWEATKIWYSRWPATQQDITHELIIFYNLTKADPAYRSPTAIRPMSGNKFMPLHPNCRIPNHKQCVTYEQLDSWWHKVVQG